MKCYNYNKEIYGVVCSHMDNISVKTDNGIKYTYEEFNDLSSRFASCIDERCLVFLQCRNRIESLATYVGMLQKRIVPLMFGTSDVSMIESLANEYKPMYICLYKDCNVCNGYYRVDTFYDLVIYKRVEEVRYLIHNDLALLLPTSGTTGSRKYVRLSYENLKVNAESIIEYLDITVDDVTITSMPMSYTYGLSLINTYLLSGATLLLTEKSIITKKFWDFFEANGGTSFSGVPYAYEVLSKTGFFNREIRTLKTLTQAGGKLREDLQDRYGKYASERNIDFYIMYGQTEATARMSYLPSEKVLEKKGSVGIPVPGGKITIENECGTECKPYEEGEIIYTGANVSMGYAEGYRELVLGDMNKGVLHTGDIGYKDSDGYLYITGRKNRFAKINGYRINLYELENKLSNIYGCDFKCNADENKIYIKGQIDRDISDELTDKTGIDKRFVEYEYVKSIPRNENGK